MAPHYGSSGAPYPPMKDLGEFAPKGAEPENVSDRGAADAAGDPEFDKALAEFAPLGKKRKLGTVKNDGEKVTIPSEKAGPYKSPTVG